MVGDTRSWGGYAPTHSWYVVGHFRIFDATFQPKLAEILLPPPCNSRFTCPTVTCAPPALPCSAPPISAQRCGSCCPRKTSHGPWGLEWIRPLTRPWSHKATGRHVLESRTHSAPQPSLCLLESFRTTHFNLWHMSGPVDSDEGSPWLGSHQARLEVDDAFRMAKVFFHAATKLSENNEDILPQEDGEGMKLSVFSVFASLFPDTVGSSGGGGACPALSHGISHAPAVADASVQCMRTILACLCKY